MGAAVEAAGLATLAATWRTHIETYEDVGSVVCRVQDLYPVWIAAVDREAVVFASDEILLDVASDVEAPREVEGDRLANPEYRAILFRSDRQEIDGSVDGRTDASSAFVCYHGDKGGPRGLKGKVDRWAATCWVSRRSTRRRSPSLAGRART